MQTTNEMIQVVPVINITIGNGKGSHSFSTNKSYTIKNLKSVHALTVSQIRKYFTANKRKNK